MDTPMVICVLRAGMGHAVKMKHLLATAVRASRSNAIVHLGTRISVGTFPKIGCPCRPVRWIRWALPTRGNWRAASRCGRVMARVVMPIACCGSQTGIARASLVRVLLVCMMWFGFPSFIVLRMQRSSCCRNNGFIIREGAFASSVLDACCCNCWRKHVDVHYMQGYMFGVAHD